MSIYSFFSESVGTPGNAIINWRNKPLGELMVYAASYQRAAMGLIWKQKEKPSYLTIDHAALPILFLYRHAFELYLKTIVYRAALIAMNESELLMAIPKLWKEHSLLALLNMARPVLQETSCPLAAGRELELRIEEAARKIDEVDSRSFSFRYPVTTSGISSLPSTFVTNIFTFSDYIENLLDDMASYCVVLERERLEASSQMKMALHGLISNG